MPLSYFLMSITPLGFSVIFGFLYCCWLTYRIVKRGNQRKISVPHKVRLYGSIFLLVSIFSAITFISTTLLGIHIYNSFGLLNIWGIIRLSVAIVVVGFLLVLFVGMMLYAMGYAMEWYKAFVSKLMLGFGVPFALFLFDMIFIYGLLKEDEPGNQKKIWTYVVLVLFIVVFTLGLLVYLKLLWKGELIPKKKSISPKKQQQDKKKPKSVKAH
jgi:MFS family permease